MWKTNQFVYRVATESINEFVAWKCRTTEIERAEQDQIIYLVSLSLIALAIDVYEEDGVNANSYA